MAGLATAQETPEYADDSVTISIIDRKDYLLFEPDIQPRPCKTVTPRCANG